MPLKWPHFITRAIQALRGSPHTGSTFQLVDGIHATDLSGVQEGYEVQAHPSGSTIFNVNVSAERLMPVFTALCESVAAPRFFLLERASNLAVEEELRQSDSDPLHKDVFYLDNIAPGHFESVIERFGELLLHDGMINFGLGSHTGVDEVFVGPYKQVFLYADDPAKYTTRLTDLSFEEVEQLRKVTDTFTQETPGYRRALRDPEVRVDKMIEQLQTEGLYFAERREN